jgi:hypothetical protein
MFFQLHVNKHFPSDKELNTLSDPEFILNQLKRWMKLHQQLSFPSKMFRSV